MGNIACCSGADLCTARIVLLQCRESTEKNEALPYFSHDIMEQPQPSFLQDGPGLVGLHFGSVALNSYIGLVRLSVWTACSGKRGLCVFW